ncbi:hypothetical protein I6J72_05605 [Corynebacterium sp. FDAARGOS 1242]|uniref:hypothetical protein n=1 Tax=Corynebacterium sp. FDAARGOS 1242 TaxID=2778078 RepID=UPI00195001FB|nr:hypothetical protein [Corynebacterium sp. FDAARGOS 1242]QRP98976.1 hypothetical protein I6J72_05605 [Corynebacterium sp. FDAARGOS 1242]
MNRDFQDWRSLTTAETRCDMAILNLSAIADEVDFCRTLIASAGIPKKTSLLYSLDSVDGILLAIKQELESIFNKTREARLKRQAKIFDALEGNE